MLKHWRREGLAAALLAYVPRIVVNAYLGRRGSRASAEIVCRAGLAEPVTSDGADERATRDVARRLLGTLDERQREVLVPRYYAALPDREIAEHLDCAEPTVRTDASRAFARFRKHPQLAELVPTHSDQTHTEA